MQNLNLLLSQSFWHTVLLHFGTKVFTPVEVRLGHEGAELGLNPDNVCHMAPNKANG